MNDTGYDRAEIAEFYDSTYTSRKDVEFYTRSAKESGGPVLELGCGTGRILVPTAKAGVAITGLDAAAAMLNRCRSRLETESEDVRSRVELVNARMQDFGLDRKFALITTPFRPFQHLLRVEDQLACLRQVHAHLKEGGTFILDVYNPWVHKFAEETQAEEVADTEFAMPDGRRVVRKYRNASRDLFNQVNDEELIYYVTGPDGKEQRIVDAFKMRYLYRFEAEHLLTRCGFGVEAIYADYDESPYGSEYPGELIIVARKV